MYKSCKPKNKFSVQNIWINVAKNSTINNKQERSRCRKKFLPDCRECNMSFVIFENVGKTYITGDVEVRALSNVNFKIEQGEICVVVGQSGAGKTTLLNILGGMDMLTDGKVLLDGRDISGFNEKQLAAYRRHDIGFVFQFYNLIPNLTALENTEIASQLSKNPLDSRTIMEKVGLGDRMDNFPAQLSGGEQQRVAIARALAEKSKASFVRRTYWSS